MTTKKIKNYDYAEGGKLWGWVCIIFGLCFMAVGIIIYFSNHKYESKGTSVNATIVEKKESTIVLSYDADGQKYQTEVAPSSKVNSEKNIGEKITIYYLNNDPNKAKVLDYSGFYGLTIFSMIPIIGGLLIIHFEKKRVRVLKELVKNNQSIELPFEITGNDNPLVGPIYYNIIGKYETEDTIYNLGVAQFLIHINKEGLKEYLSKQNITTLPFFVDKKNPKYFALDRDLLDKKLK